MERGDGSAGEDQIQVQVLREPAAAACGPRTAARCVWLGWQGRWFLCWGSGRGVVAGAR
jgi:hypothetical protein